MPGHDPPLALNVADYFLDGRVQEGRGDKLALDCGERRLTYRDVQALANRFAHVLRRLGLDAEQRVLIALPDGPEFVGALFGAFKSGAVAVMANPGLKPEEIAYFYEYTRARVAVVHAAVLPAFAAAAGGSRWLRRILVVGGEPQGHASFEAEARSASEDFENVPTHRDDACLWLFSGGTTGRPKAVVQSHRSYVNTTERYAKETLGYRESDRTLSIPKLFFGYATGSNLFFPFSVGATAVLFPEHPTAEVVFERIRAHRPTILVNVPAMVSQMCSQEGAERQDLSSLRFCTSAGEALPPELHRRFLATFGVELLDGLGTAEMWHIFLTNRPGSVRPGTLGRVVEGFDVRVRDDDGRDLPPGEVGALWVRGGSLAHGYWQQHEETVAAFRGEWYVSGDLVSRDADGYFTYAGRADDMLKVSGKWVAPAEVEDCLLSHPSVRECAVVGVADGAGLTKPRAYVVPRDLPPGAGLAEELQAFVRDRLAAYKYPREVVFVPDLPRTHLGKVDRGRLRKG